MLGVRVEPEPPISLVGVGADFAASRLTWSFALIQRVTSVPIQSHSSFAISLGGS